MFSFPYLFRFPDFPSSFPISHSTSFQRNNIYSFLPENLSAASPLSPVYDGKHLLTGRPICGILYEHSKFLP